MIHLGKGVGGETLWLRGARAETDLKTSSTLILEKLSGDKRENIIMTIYVGRCCIKKI